MDNRIAISRRSFVLGSAAVAAASMLAIEPSGRAYAQTVQSSSATYDGKQYSLTATAQRLAEVGLATGNISCAFTLPTVYLGIQARLYDTLGALRASQTLYTKKATSSMASMASDKVGSLSVQAAATGYVWRPSTSTYSSFTTGKTPVTQARSKSDKIGVFPVNDAGLSYGSLYEAEANGLPEPDLVKVCGVGGIVGYIYGDELHHRTKAASPEAALALMEQGSIVIPVYQSDGATVVDKFELSFA